MECSNRCSMEIKGGQPGSWQGTGCRVAAAQAETAASLCVHGWWLKARLIALVTLSLPMFAPWEGHKS